MKPPDTAEKSLGEIVSDVSEKASLLVREEIELAKAEVTDKATKIGKGVAAFAGAGIFLFFFLIFVLHTAAWVLSEELDVKTWVGYGIVSLTLLVLAAIAGLVGLRFVKRGTPPTPELAIEEAKETKVAIDKARS